jgi:hypothetical protein
MNSFFSRRTMIWACLMVLGILASPATSGAVAKPDPKAKKPGFRLLARAGGALQVNQVFCGLISDGQICVDSLQSSTIPGGFWPKGTNDQYTFNSGISIAAIIGPEVAGWAGDTTGAFFFDGGGKQNGEQVEPIYNAGDPADFNAWPDFARVPSPPDPGAALYDPLLQGAISASQGDVWFLTWDGNPTALAGRPHPLGVAVETRGLAWNYPSGNQDILYFIYTLYNISSINEADYALVREPLRRRLLDKAREFQTRNEAAFGVDIPDGGYTITQAFMAFTADQDVADAGANHATFNNAFSLAVTYHDHLAPIPGNTFDPSIFGPPFLAGPGFVGTKYLRSPFLDTGVEAGTVLAGMTTNRGGFTDPVSTAQLYRYLSGNLNTTGDPQCNTGVRTVTHICFVNSTAADARTFQSSGPFTLAPGGQATIVVGYIYAAALATTKCPTIPCPVAMVPDPLRLSQATPGSPGVDAIDSAMGYRGLASTAGSGGAPITQTDFVDLPPGSLLQKAIVAQTVFNGKFLLPFAPVTPEFFLVPGDNQVSILWRPSPSEDTGDPFYAIAQQPTTTQTQPDGSIVTIPNPSYDPNYRQDDVEGYRIYRGRTDNPNQLELVAQFDKQGTVIHDYRGFVNPTATCAPELGIGAADPACPFDPPADGVAPVDSVDYFLTGKIIQVRLGGRQALANGEALIVSADTVFSRATGFPDLADTGVPFAFTDDGSGLVSAPRNNVRYFYAVTAFDVNSFKSAPGSLESPRSARPTTPVKGAANVETASLSSSISGDDDVELDPSPRLTIDPTTGRFPGPPPPTNSVEGAFAPLVPVLLPTLDMTATIDSVKARSVSDPACGGVSNALGSCYLFYASMTREGTTTQFVSPQALPIWTSLGDPAAQLHGNVGGLPVLPDAAVASRFGVPAGAGAANAAIAIASQQYIDWSSFEGQAARRNRIGNNAANAACAAALDGCATAVSPGGSRWFGGTAETVDHPAVSIRVGHIPGVDTVWAPIHHVDVDPVTPDGQPVGGVPTSGLIQFFGYGFAGLSRQADVQLTWGDAGAVASIRDVTHHVPVRFAPDVGASYGFVADGDGDGVISWEDFNFIPGVVAFWAENVGSNGPTDPAAPGVPLTPAPAVTSVSTSFTGSNATTLSVPYTATGQGFGLYINGERYIFQLTGGALPPSGTVWTLRTYTGRVSATTNPASAAPSGYVFTAAPARSPVVPGLKVTFTVSQPTQVLATSQQDLEQIHTVPDPYYVTSSLETSTTDKIIKFVNLPTQAIIRIYSSSGVLVSVLEHNSTTLGGDETWNVRNRNNQVVASGVYFYHIESGGARRIGRFTVVNFAQ